MSTFWRALSALFFLMALAALAFLLGSDLWSRLAFTQRHVQVQALALVFAGTSFICLQLGLRGRWRDTLKGVLLGFAFVVWGAEQFLAQGPAVVAADCVVISIFILDLALVIAGHLWPRSGVPAAKQA